MREIVLNGGQRLSGDIRFPGWGCRHEVDWPEGKKARVSYGLDALQALVIALQLIGSELYISTYRANGLLRASDQETGYGFSVPLNMRDMLISVGALSF